MDRNASNGGGSTIGYTHIVKISNSGFLWTFTENIYQVTIHLKSEPTPMASWPRAAWRFARRQSVRNTAHNVCLLCCHLYRVYLTGMLLVIREYRFSAAQRHKLLLMFVSMQCIVTQFFVMEICVRKKYYEGWNFNSGNIYLQLIQNRYIFRSITVLHCSHQHCVQPVASDVEVVGYL